MFLPCVHELWTNWRRSLFPDRRRPPSHGPWLHWIRQWRLALGWLRPPRRQTRIWTRSFGRRGRGGWTGPGCHTSPATTAPWDQQPWTAGGGWVHWEDHPKEKTIIISYLWGQRITYVASCESNFIQRSSRQLLGISKLQREFNLWTIITFRSL